MKQNIIRSFFGAAEAIADLAEKSEIEYSLTADTLRDVLKFGEKYNWSTRCGHRDGNLKLFSIAEQEFFPKNIYEQCAMLLAEQNIRFEDPWKDGVDLDWAVNRINHMIGLLDIDYMLVVHTDSFSDCHIRIESTVEE